VAHQRKQIRDAIVARLIGAPDPQTDPETFATAAGARVFANRAKPLFPSELPAILVYTKNETSQISNEAPREYNRGLVVQIEIVASALSAGSLDDALDALAEQVETAIFSEETFGGLVTDTILGETEMELLEEGEKPIGAARISLSMPYYQQLPGDLTAALDDFKTMQTDVEATNGAEISGTDDVPQA
jgi:hypothetical protein